MSEPCYRGYKCMCFQCDEKDCERYEPEPPEWEKAWSKDDQFFERYNCLWKEEEQP